MAQEAMTTHKTTPKSSQDNGVWFCWDTPQFQRLRNIKQLGGAYFVYSGASHNRFEHSIGVAHLAGELEPALKTSQPELKVNNRDVLCVQIAGLCHDLGHGPFSYLFGTCINKARPEKDWKVFNDPIHGTVELHPLLVKIIDTPQFQRLRYIKQLGGVYYVFPGATHNRFQHSIGVAHLAGELVKSLQTRQPELNINNRDVLCVQIAGLCHDLGHGPFSHSFEKFIHKAHPGSNWTHEKASLEMFDHLVDVNKLEPVMEQHGLVLPEDLDFIKEQIGGPPVTDAAPGQKPPKGPPPEDRRKDKPFLYEIVANKRNGVDVDKFDYLARDAHHLGIQNNFNYRRFIKFARVCEVDGQKQICTRDKEVNNLYELYHLRYTLHRKACQHSVNNIIESMITKAFLKADEHIQIQGSGKEMFTLSTAIKDMKAYTKLTDHVYEEILYSPNPKLAEAQKILKKVVARNHPRFLGERELTKTMIIKLEDMTPEAEEKLKRRWEEDLAACQDDGLKAKDFEVHIIKFDYGAKSDDPIDEMRFYNKRDLDVAFKLPDYQKSVFHPKYCSEKLIRVYYKNTDETSVKKAYKHMDLWWETKRPNFKYDTEGDRSPGGNIQNTE